MEEPNFSDARHGKRDDCQRFNKIKQLYAHAEHFVQLKESHGVAILLNTDGHDRNYYVVCFSNKRNELIQMRFRSMELAERCFLTWLNT